MNDVYQILIQASDHLRPKNKDGPWVVERGYDLRYPLGNAPGVRKLLKVGKNGKKWPPDHQNFEKKFFVVKSFKSSVQPLKML